MAPKVFTIGHSTQSLDRFVSLLQAAGITAISDVRSSPFSRMNPQFNRNTLKERLKREGIKYVFLGKELGARSDDETVYVNGQAKYDRIAETKTFKDGIQRVVNGAKQYRLALMCAEKEPLDCHRTILVSRRLVDEGLEVEHILYDGSIESHDHAINRLIAQLGITPPDMLRPRTEAVNEAYEKQGNEIAYKDPEKAIEASYSDREGRQSYS